MRYNRVTMGYAACITCRARLSHPITDRPVVLVVSLFHSTPFHSIPFQFHSTLSIPVTCLDAVRRVREVGEPMVCVCAHAAILCGHLTAHPMSPFIPFHVTFHSIPCCPSTHIEDSLDSADGLGVESTLDSLRRVVASIQRHADQADGYPGCTSVIVVKAIHPWP